MDLHNSKGTAGNASWLISEVERLVGLPRRDIQRACYDGAGGVAILSPAGGTWGKRFYSVDDLAVLFVTSEFKHAGYSLPEIGRLFDETREPGGGYGRFLDTAYFRLREEAEALASRLLKAESLRLALGPTSEPASGLVSRTQAQVPGMTAGIGTDAPGRTSDPAKGLSDLIGRHILVAAVHNLDHGAPKAAAELHRCLGDLGGLMAGGFAANTPRVRDRVAACLAACAEACGGTTSAAGPDGSPSPQADDISGFVREALNTPGIDLPIELWLGPGAYAYLCAAWDGVEFPDAPAGA